MAEDLTSNSESYQLPSDPSLLCDDPLSLSESKNSPVAAWDLISAVVSSQFLSGSGQTNVRSLEALPGLVQDLAYSLHRDGSLDTSGLARFIASYSENREAAEGDGSSIVYANILSAALSLPDHFPTHKLPYLTATNPSVTLIPGQINTLLAHQLLGTLSQPPGNNWGRPELTFLYAQNPAQPPGLVNSYLRTLFHHFRYLGSDEESNHVTYTLYDAQIDEIKWGESSLPLTLGLIPIGEESDPPLNHRLSGNPISKRETRITLVPSHRQPGPGPGATHEERLFSISPFLAPVPLLVPSLPPNAALYVSEVPLLAAWKGHGRRARLEKLFSPDARPRRGYVFADALELDSVIREEGTGLVDLEPELISRELTKLYAAFWSVREATKNGIDVKPVVEAGAWGCGAFGGNVVVKSLLLAIAAKATGVELELRLRNSISESSLVAKVLDRGWKAENLRKVLSSGELKGCVDGAEFVNALTRAMGTREGC